jgi:hypothetical protein
MNSYDGRTVSINEKTKDNDKGGKKPKQPPKKKEKKRKKSVK